MFFFNRVCDMFNNIYFYANYWSLFISYNTNCFFKYRYTIYTLSLEKMLHSPWTSQATMVVIYGTVPDELYPLLEKYLLTEGGRILCLCSDFLGTLLPTAFSTAEVRSDDVVSFTYHPLSLHMSLLHHVLCYQPSVPNNDHFPSENG